VYLVRCADQSLYCGVTNNLKRRLRAHNSGNGAKYTRSRRPVTLVGLCKNLTRRDALKLEHRIKKLPADRKLEQLKKGKEMLKMINNEKIKKEIRSLAADMQKVAEKINMIAASIASYDQQDDQAEMPKKKAERVSTLKRGSSRIENEDADKSTAPKAVPA
jgi:putative endonuclease